jgi:hypothetical protein
MTARAAGDSRPIVHAAASAMTSAVAKAGSSTARSRLGDRVGVDELVRALGQQQLRDAGRQCSQQRSAAAGVHGECRTAQDRDPVDQGAHLDVGRQRAELGAERDEDVGVERCEAMERRQQDLVGGDDPCPASGTPERAAKGFPASLVRDRAR